MRQYLFILPAALFLASCGAQISSAPVSNTLPAKIDAQTNPIAQPDSLNSQNVTFELNPSNTCDLDVKISAKDNTQWELSASGESYEKTLDLDSSSVWQIQAHCQNQPYGNPVTIQVDGHPHYTIGTQNSGVPLGGGLYLSK